MNIDEIATFLLTKSCEIRKLPAMMEPAHTVIKICGGISVVAEMVSRSEVRVRRWGYPKARGGSDGIIPAELQQLLLREAISRGIPLRPEHFFSASLLQAEQKE
ncbi:hypothetical protein [Thioclava sp. GXIMD4215]|uniref:hypothetical protein n=1 Tax=Thioclava sp. GXIMD4215 TaxID=3131928 RepID=UPI0032513C18